MWTLVTALHILLFLNHSIFQSHSSNTTGKEKTTYKYSLRTGMSSWLPKTALVNHNMATSHWNENWGNTNYHSIIILLSQKNIYWLLRLTMDFFVLSIMYINKHPKLKNLSEELSSTCAILLELSWSALMEKSLVLF